MISILLLSSHFNIYLQLFIVIIEVKFLCMEQF